MIILTKWKRIENKIKAQHLNEPYEHFAWFPCYINSDYDLAWLQTIYRISFLTHDAYENSYGMGHIHRITKEELEQYLKERAEKQKTEIAEKQKVEKQGDIS